MHCRRTQVRGGSGGGMRQLEHAAGGSGNHSGSGSPGPLQLSPRPHLPAGAGGPPPVQAALTQTVERRSSGAEASPSGSSGQAPAQQHQGARCQSGGALTRFPPGLRGQGVHMFSPRVTIEV